jgi:hypothetical protein
MTSPFSTSLVPRGSSEKEVVAEAANLYLYPAMTSHASPSSLQPTIKLDGLKVPVIVTTPIPYGTFTGAASSLMKPTT